MDNLTWKKLFNTLLMALCVVSFAACSQSEIHPEADVKAEVDENPPENTEVPEPGMLFPDHSMAGKIWDEKAKKFISKGQLIQSVRDSDYVLLGETHDNPVHHQGQAWVIEQLSVNGRPAQVAFEMIAQQQGEFIAGKDFETADVLIAALGHVPSTWDYERFYKPVFERALEAGYGVYAANYDRDKIMSIAREGVEKIPPSVKHKMDSTVLSDEQIAASRKEIEGSHCGMINDIMTASMMLVQRAKDALMAQSMESSSAVNVLIAGSGHVRNDRGVPVYLPQADGKKIVTIAWVEVQLEMRDVASYADYWGSQQLPFDYVWFTPRVDRPDPCVQFREHMKNREQAES
ncbi:MAG: ChaN family lipoprotein [Ectothiorhodospiraceae bacterium]|nr:ChaN family lipoprotein [Ectothiorhodospiraceae bacterium]